MSPLTAQERVQSSGITSIGTFHRAVLPRVDRKSLQPQEDALKTKIGEILNGHNDLDAQSKHHLFALVNRWGDVRTALEKVVGIGRESTLDSSIQRQILLLVAGIYCCEGGDSIVQSHRTDICNLLNVIVLSTRFQDSGISIQQTDLTSFQGSHLSDMSARIRNRQSLISVYSFTTR